MGRGQPARCGKAGQSQRSGSPPQQLMAREMLAPPALWAVVLPEGPQGQAQQTRLLQPSGFAAGQHGALQGAASALAGG